MNFAFFPRTKLVEMSHRGGRKVHSISQIFLSSLVMLFKRMYTEILVTNYLLISATSNICSYIWVGA